MSLERLPLSKRSKEIIEKEGEILSLTTRVPYYPLIVDRAKGCKVYDIEGNEYIDFLASAAVMNIGHNHLKVVDAIHKQVDKFIHYTPAYVFHEPHTKLAEKLIEITPGDFPKRVSFSLSGSSAVDCALKAARAYTRREHIISFQRSYHGTTIGALSVSAYSSGMRSGVGSLVNNVHFIPFPDYYRGVLGETKETDELCIQYLNRLLETEVRASDVAAIVMEVIQGDAGMHVPSDHYLQVVSDICRENKILLIADEIHTGFGRTGKMFASELYNLEPDFMVLGKAIASGMPISAVVARAELFEAWGPPSHFFNTAGNPISCEAALATIHVLETEGVLENVSRQNEYIVNRFRKLQERFDCIGDIRGVGLFLGVDIVKNRDSKERDYKTAAKLCWRCYEKGLILAFLSDSVLRIEPPLTITTEESEKAMNIIESALDDVVNNRVDDSVLEFIKGW